MIDFRELRIASAILFLLYDICMKARNCTPMKHSFLFIFFLTSSLCFAQGSDTLLAPISIRANIGTFIPTANLSNQLNSGIRLGLEYSLKVSDKYKLGLGGEALIPWGQKSFDFVMPDSVYNSKANVVFNGFIKVTQFEIVNHKHIWEKYIGLGISFLSTDTYDEYYADVFGNNNFGTSSMFFVLGTSYQYILSEKYTLGISAEYCLIPFSTFSDYLRPDFGSQMLRLGLTFDFEHRNW